MTHARQLTKTFQRMTTEERLIWEARKLSAEAEKLRFAPPVTHVYNPLALCLERARAISARASAARARRWFFWA